MPAPDRDPYANLLRETRGMREEQIAARAHWLNSVAWEKKDAAVFELEALLKGIVCFGNARNQPGPPTDQTPALSHDFSLELRIVRDGLDRVIALTRQLLGDREREYAFARYFDSVIPDDAVRAPFVHERLRQTVPEDSLFLLLGAFTNFVQLIDAALRVGRTSQQAFYAVHELVTREIARSAYFNPLFALEFTVETDRIRSPRILEALAATPTGSGHRTVALTMLALLRAGRYLGLVDESAADPESAYRSYLHLAALRSDIRALTRFLSVRAADALADGFEDELLALSADKLRDDEDILVETARVLARIRGVLEAVASALRIEVRRIYERELPEIHAQPQTVRGPEIAMGAAQLRAAVAHAIDTVVSEVRGETERIQTTRFEGDQLAVADRLRRDVWMFNQVVRAFLAKADATQNTSDLWIGKIGFEFVRDFIRHFRALGYQLVRTADYTRFEPLLVALERLREVDALDPKRVASVVEECRTLHKFLEQLFTSVSSRAELVQKPFDKRAAAETLRMYLGAT